MLVARLEEIQRENIDELAGTLIEITYQMAQLAEKELTMEVCQELERSRRRVARIMHEILVERVILDAA